LGKVKAAIWRNDGEYGTRHNVKFSRIFKTEDGWDNSTSFGRDELPLVEKVANLAHLWIYEHADDDTSDSSEQGDRLRQARNGKRAAAR
jgi:hypothetical protein